jgi:large subunit ribosomal protein L22
MGSRKKIQADIRKEEQKTKYFALLRNFPTSPRKMRLVADMIRGRDVLYALNVLKFSTKVASLPMEKLLKSAIANWEAKNEGQQAKDSQLFVSQVNVDSARMLKRFQPAPQGRAHRIRKRSNHVTIFIDKKENLD